MVVVSTKRRDIDAVDSNKSWGLALRAKDSDAGSILEEIALDTSSASCSCYVEGRAFRRNSNADQTRSVLARRTVDNYQSTSSIRVELIKVALASDTASINCIKLLTCR